MSAWYLVLALLFVLANGYFVAAEFAIVKLRPTQLAELVERGSGRALMAKRISERLNTYLSATQLGVTLASLALGWVGEPVFEHLIEPLFKGLGTFGPAVAHSVAATVAFAVITTLHIIFGELGPKWLAIQKPAGTALAIAYPLHAFYLVTYPAIWILSHLSAIALRVFGLKPAGANDVIHSEEELRLILAHSEKAGVLSEENREIIEGVFEFSRRTARHIMVPRTDIVVLSTKNSIEQNLEIIYRTRHTRYPLCDGDLDNTVGLIHVKDLFLAQLRGPGKPLVDLRREILFVPENSTVDSILAQFLEHKTHMAVVLDEYGGASGIVTLENITEELFGQIQDEFDRERPEVEPLVDGKYRVRGDYLIEDLVDRLKVDVGEQPEETIGGYVAAHLTREPQPGDQVDLGPLSVEVIEAERLRVRWVLVQKKKDEREEGEREEA